MQMTEEPPPIPLINKVAERRAGEILRDVPRSRVTSQAGEGGAVALNVEVAGRPMIREFIVPDLDLSDTLFVASLLELRHIAVHCPSWRCESRELEERAHHLRRAALEENQVRPVTIHGFRYGRDGHEEQVF